MRLSVEYGTANTVAVVEWPGGRRQVLVVPSGVAVDTGGRLVAGAGAVHEARLDPGRFLACPALRLDEPEVPLGGRTWPVVDLVAVTLAEVRRAVGWAEVAQLVLVHPIGWAPARVELLAAAAAAAGLPAPVLVAAPLAVAAMLPGPEGSGPRPPGRAGLAEPVVPVVPGPVVPVGQAVIVYHLGAGSFEACVVRRGPAGWQSLAHRTVDRVDGVGLDEVLAGRVAAAGVAEDVRVGREDSEGLAEPALARTVEATMTAVVEAGVSPAEVGAVLLAGADSAMPLVSALLALATGFTPVMLGAPGSTAACGALEAAAPLAADPRREILRPGFPSAIRPMRQLALPVATRPTGWRWVVLVGVAAVVVLAVVAGFALLASGSHGGTATASSTGDSQYDEPSPAPTLTPRADAPHLNSTFVNSNTKLCAELNYSPLADVFGTPPTTKPGGFIDAGDAACQRGLTKPGVPSPTMKDVVPGVQLWCFYKATPAEARDGLETEYGLDAASSDGGKTMRFVDVGDMGYAYQGAADPDPPSTIHVGAVTGNVQIFADIVDPDQTVHWTAASRDQALTAAATFVRDNLPLLENG